MSTPQTVDLFSRYMAEMFDDKSMIAVSTGFQSFFGNPAAGAETIFSPDANVVDIDIIRGNKKIAALIPRGMVSRPLGSTQKNLNTEKFSTFSRKYPLAEEEGDITGDILNNRIAGENPYERRDRFDRLRYHARKIHTESIRRIVDMNEVLAAQSILEGKQDAIIGTTDTNLQYDFRRNAAHITTVGTAWSTGTADIFGDIDAACEKIKKNGRTIPNFMGIAGNALKAMIEDTNFSNIADNRRFEWIQVSDRVAPPREFQRHIDNGWQARGLLVTPEGYNLWVFTYHGYYENSAGTAVDYLPDGQAFITNANARFDRYFGPPENLPMIPQRVQLYQEFFGFNPLVPMMEPRVSAPGNVVDPNMFYCDAYVSSDWKKITVRTQEAPIYATTHTDAIVTLKGLVV